MAPRLPVRIGIYARISDDQEGRQTATARQLQDAREFAERKGWEVADVFEDVDLSAFKTKVKRPEFERMVGLLRAGEIDGVLVWKLDRLSRQQRDFATVMEACEAHRGFVASVTEPIHTHEPHGQFVAELLVAQARMESANTSARSLRKAQELREQGRPPTSGKRSFGYSRDYLQIIPEEAAVLREVRDRVLAGESMSSLARDLMERGIRSPWGNHFRPHTLKRTLLSPTVRGERERDGVSYTGTWPAIFTSDEARQLRTVFEKRPGQPRSSPVRSYLLTGLVRCGRCGARLRSHKSGKDVPRYVCTTVPGTSACGKLSARADAVDNVVAEMLFLAVDGQALTAALQWRGDPDEGVVEAIRSDEESLETLSKDHYVDRLISRQEFMAARGELNRRLETNRAKLAKRTKTNVLRQFAGGGEVLRAAWEVGSLQWRHSIVAALLDHVEIAPGSPGRRPLDPRRVRPVWRV
jgi:DNA invertase Pin-like site-specific DNA recombinase